MKQLSRADANKLSDFRDADEKLARLPHAMLEKDVFITEAILAVAALKNSDIEVVFCGGTSLSKAHGLVERMSEDVDFKLDVRDRSLSKNQRRGLLSAFRDTTVSELKKLGYEIQDEHVKSRDANRYTEIQLPYKTSFTQLAAIRPDVRIELNASSPRIATVMCDVQTLVSRGLTLSRAGSVPCLDVSETMAEKIVAFTRRAAHFLRGKTRGEFDTTLVRHLYDVYQLENAGGVSNDVVLELAGHISKNDAIEFARQHPEYVSDPKGETQRSLNALTEDHRFEDWYNQFVDIMIYGDQKPQYPDVVEVFRQATSKCMNLATPAPADRRA